MLYSDPVQAIFAAQNGVGFWGDVENLAQPYYNATVWNLALLAELGIPRTSRRARNACEFILQNFLNDDGTFAGLNALESGYLVRAFGYFNYANDSRALCAARRLRQEVDSYETGVVALWGWRAFTHDEKIADAAKENLERVLRNLQGLGANTFPQFEPRDELFFLRVLAEYDRVHDARAAPLLDALVAKQNERAQWTLERDLNAQLVTSLERAGEPSRWITLNALRVIVKLVAQK